MKKSEAIKAVKAIKGDRHTLAKVLTVLKDGVDEMFYCPHCGKRLDESRKEDKDV